VKGSVVRVRADRGFCFVKAFDEERDRFLHFSDIDYPADLIHVGMVLEFDPSDGPKGPRAQAARPQVTASQRKDHAEFEGLFSQPDEFK